MIFSLSLLSSFFLHLCTHSNDEVPDDTVLRAIMTGKPTALSSQFRLTFNMILNLLRAEDFKVEDMIKRSFSEASRQKEAPLIESKLKQVRYWLP